ncbi:MAG: hypothetical protein JNJ56_13210 [Ignavibacteria bacterium]|nr:hypothetical protein [Ignavibacteria bacterium]
MEKKFMLTCFVFPLIALMIVSFFSLTAYADISGRTGRTLRTSTSGCSCHGSRDVATSITISGPSTVTTGSTNTYTLTVLRSGKTGAGCDISTRKGVLNIISTTIHKSGVELTHNDNIPMISNTVSILFSYTAPAIADIDTIFATGLATNSSGDENGDLWNWAPSFRVDVVPPLRILHLTVLIEGFYNPGSGSQVIDTARVYLRNTSLPYAIIDSAKAVLDNLGKADFSFSNAANGTPYYLDVKHRNSIETWSSGGNSFVSNSMTFNFTTSSSQAYGNNLQLVGTKWTLFSGDVNLDGIIDASDLSQVENDAAAGQSGYVQTDVTGDDYVDAGDLSIVENNAAVGVYVVTP